MQSTLFVNIGNTTYLDVDDVSSFGPFKATGPAPGVARPYRTIIVLKNGTKVPSLMAPKTVKKRIQAIINYRAGVQHEA